MYIHNINPTLIEIGPLEIRWYGLIFLLGFIMGFFWLDYQRKKNKINLTKDDIYDLIFYLALGIVIGSRLFEVLFWEPGYYFSNPSKIIAIWEGGLAFHGGLFGAILAIYWFSKKKKISLAKLADILVIPAVFGLALGRIANFINGELWGTITNVSWCVKFPGVEGCRHPVQIYGAIKRFIVLGILLLINKKEHKDGFLAWNMILFLGVGRFIVDFVREDARFILLSTGQYFSILMVIISVIVILKFYKTDLKNLFNIKPQN